MNVLVIFDMQNLNETLFLKFNILCVQLLALVPLTVIFPFIANTLCYRRAYIQDTSFIFLLAEY